MRKTTLALVIALAVVLIGCELEPGILNEEAVRNKEAVRVNAVFGIAVTSIANNATITEEDLPLTIAGAVSETATAVTVNDYQLQAYTPGSGEWRYVINPDFGNIVAGENIYEITAVGPDDISTTTELKLNYQVAE
ncbi:MAG: hypothetical protein ABIH35_02195 [Patescibacteria group bacterium]